MIKPVIDMHTHSIMSGHAYGTIREMAQAAADRGIELLGISDHALPTPGAPHNVYFACAPGMPSSLCGIKVLAGAEVNILDYAGTLSLPKDILDKLEYRIGSMHYDSYTPGTKAENTRAAVAAMKSGYVDILGHPDDSFCPLDYAEITAAAADCMVLPEINTASVKFKDTPRRTDVEKNLMELLSQCEKRGIPVIANSDAHDPSKVGVLDLPLAMIEKAGFPDELVINRSVAELELFLEKRRAVYGLKVIKY